MLKTSIALSLLLFASSLDAQSAAPAIPPIDAPYEFMLARFAAEEGKYAEALERMDRVVAREPANPVVLFERASILVSAGKSEKARTELESIARRFPDFYDAHRLLGRMLLEGRSTSRENLDAALEQLRAAVRLNPDDANSALTVAQLLLATDRAAEAERVLANLAERLPSNKVVNFNYASVLGKLGRTDESRLYLERAVANDPTYSAAVLQLIELYQKSGDWKKAAEILAPLSAQDPTNGELQQQQGYLYLRAGESAKAVPIFEEISRRDPKDERSRFLLAEALSDSERFTDAEAIYRKLLEATPGDPETLASLAMNLMAQHRYDDAEPVLTKLIATEAIPPGVRTLAKTQLALIELYRGNDTAALAKSRELVVGPSGLNLQAAGLATEIFRRQKRYDDAIAFLRPLIKQYPTEGALQARLLEFLLRAGQKKEAAEVSAALQKTGARGAVTVADVDVSVGRFADAIDILKALVEKTPDDKALQFQLAAAYERAGDYSAAEKIFLALLDREPDDATTLNYLGYMWADRGVNLSRAEELVQRAVSQDPRNGAFIDSLGWVYFKQGKFDLARKQLTDAADLLPFDATVQQHLGDALARLGKTAEALDRYRTALRLDPAADDLPQLKSKIVKLEKGSTDARP